MDDISNLFFHLIILGFLLILSAFFSGSETAFFSLSNVQIERLQQSNGKTERLVAKLLNNPHRLLVTILLGNTLVNTASASLVASFVTNVFGDKGIGLAIVFTTILLLFFGEITPKTLAIRYSEFFSKLFVYPLEFFSKVIFPIRITFDFIADGIIKILDSNLKPIYDKITSEELKTAVDIAEEEGSIKQQEKEILSTIFDLKNITASEIMIPRTEIVCASDDMPLQELFEMARSTRHSRIPIYKDDMDHIYGVAYIRDFPKLRNLDLENVTIKEFVNLPHEKDMLIRAPFFAPETRACIGLLQDFKEKMVQISILLDEYGGTAGLVTMADIVTELVGEFTGNYDEFSEDFRMINDNTFIVSGRTTIRNVNKKLDLNLPAEEDVDTIGGYVTSLFGHIPNKDEIISDGDLEFQVVSMDERRIMDVQIKKLFKNNLEDEVE
ncbi:TPA: HlyC/CorC family transporter [bacterium]|nr:HlyC/CorC family transporter [bacterium]